MSLSATIDTIIHRYFRVPYSLHVIHFQSPKKPRATIVLLHGIGNSARAWDDLVPLLPSDIRVIGVDLLGFGASAKPAWASYSAAQQSRSLGVTLLRLRLNQQIILIGHSLGALVAIDVAKRYPFLAKQLILCSPPFYDLDKTKNFSYEKSLHRLYITAKRHPDKLASLSHIAVKLGIANRSLSINDKNIDAYMSALTASIINQTSLSDIRRLKLPIRILYGTLDPVVISKYIDKLDKHHENITIRALLHGHEITGKYTRLLANEIKEHIN